MLAKPQLAGPVGDAVATDGMACRICNSGDVELVALREMLFGTREPFDYVHCRSCGSIQIAELPTDLGRYYPPEYFEARGGTVDIRKLGPVEGLADRTRNAAYLFGRGRLIAGALRSLRPAMLHEVRLERPFVRRAGLTGWADPILDVGCGQFPGRLARLRTIGFTNLTGIDPWIAGDADMSGIRVLRREIQDIDGEFQAVMLHHAFEHVPDPAAVLTAAGRLLRHGGVLLIRMPVMETWFWETYGRDWGELDPPRHLVVQSLRSFQLLAARAGLAITSVDFDSTYEEIIASEQIRRDIAWREPRSWHVQPPGEFDDEVLDRYRATAERLNREARGGRAAFYLRRTDEEAGAGRSA